MPRSIIIAAISISLITHAYAASPLFDLDASPDIAVDLSGTIATGNQTARDNLSGSITLQVFISVADEDILEYDPTSAIWELAYDASAQVAGWADGPDLDAFDVTELLIVGAPYPTHITEPGSRLAG